MITLALWQLASETQLSNCKMSQCLKPNGTFSQLSKEWPGRETKGTGDVKTWGHIGVKNDLKFIHDIWNFARMRILDRSNFPINFKCSLSVCPSVNLS